MPAKKKSTRDILKSKYRVQSSYLGAHCYEQLLYLAFLRGCSKGSIASSILRRFLKKAEIEIAMELSKIAKKNKISVDKLKETILSEHSPYAKKTNAKKIEDIRKIVEDRLDEDMLEIRDNEIAIIPDERWI